MSVQGTAAFTSGGIGGGGEGGNTGYRGGAAAPSGLAPAGPSMAASHPSEPDVQEAEHPQGSRIKTEGDVDGPRRKDAPDGPSHLLRRLAAAEMLALWMGNDAKRLAKEYEKR